MKLITIINILSLALVSCTGSDHSSSNNQKIKTMITDSTQQYGYNRDFLKKHIDVLELRRGNAAIAVIPGWQGRVMTSTADGDNGYSFGWINHDLIASGKILPHINAFGGEERLWLGPEGGQFSLFFKKGKSFVFDEWQTPAFMDTSPYELLSATDTSANFATDVITENYSGTLLNFRIERNITLLSYNEILKITGIDSGNFNIVAYQSINKLINKGNEEWKKETGLLSLWMLGMFNPAPSVVVVIPIEEGDEKIIGPLVNDNYFGEISEERLKIRDKHIYFKADGKSRGKIGIPPLRATGIMGSYDSDNKVLTILICKLPEGETDYVNSSWQIQENPYSGDALNSYNDGPLEDGSQMGPFYELETSSPAAKLKPGESLSHIQVTIHLTGKPEELDKVSHQILGVGIEEITGAF